MKSQFLLDYEMVDYIKYCLLSNKDYDADIIYRAANLCEVYPVFYILFNNWMKETDQGMKDHYYDQISYLVPIIEDYLF